MDLDSSVSYQVSDSLRHRHAYSCQQAEGKPGRGKGAGFGFWGVADGIRVLSDDSDSADKEEALIHLLKQLASCELVSRLVGGLTPSCQQAEGKPGRGKGAGFGFWGVADSICVLSDDSDSADKEEALAHLPKQLASCELVSRLVGGGLIPRFNALSVVA
ncbi:hypothetical protein DIPPA_02863 [Diplonema papillatum]|nr:hypothetical protein DIPPA_02863 [Diplonema papillatum]